jgi:hypothetical protein
MTDIDFKIIDHIIACYHSLIITLDHYIGYECYH